MNEFEKNVRSELRAAERELDPETITAICNLRKDVLAHARPRRLRRLFVPAFSMAMASVVAMVLVFSPSLDQGDSIAPGNPKLSENADLYEDMDFYYWLAQAGDDMKG